MEKRKFFGVATVSILAINIGLYILINMMPNLSEYVLLSSDWSRITQRPWTLVTVFFSHEIHIHILLNMLVFATFGMQLERITSRKTIWGLYILAGLIGSAVIVPVSILLEKNSLIAGASASVFGIAATFAVLRPDQLVLKSKAKWWLLSLVVFNLVIFVVNPSVGDSSAAHLAGILVGVIIGKWLKRKESNKVGEFN